MNSITKTFTKYVSTNIIGMVGLSCYILADTFFVAKSLGTVGLAALNFSISIYSVMQGLGLMLGIGGATRYAVFRSENREDRGNRVFTRALILGGLLSVVLMVIGGFFTTPLSKALGAGGQSLPLTAVYLKTLLLFAPFFLCNNILLAFVRNDGGPRLAMTAMLVSSFSNIVLDYVFMFPFSMGMFGAAFATGLSPVISLCILSLHFIRKKNGFRLCRCWLRISAVKAIASLGFSSLIMELASAIALITFNWIILGVEGTVGVAAYGIIANIALIATAIFTGIAQGLQPLASRCYGQRDFHSAKKILKLALGTGAALAALLYLLILCFSGQIITAFNSEGNGVLAEIAQKGAVIYFSGFFFAGVNLITAAFLSALFHTKQAMLIALLRSCLLMVPMVLILGNALGMTGIWLSFVVTELLVCLFSLVQLKRFRWRDESQRG